MIEVEAINISQIERRLGQMREKAPKVLKLAVNDTAKKARTRLAKEAQKTYTVKASGFKRVMTIKSATNSDAVAVVHAKGQKIPIVKFSFRRGTLGTGKYFNPTLKSLQTGAGGVGASGKLLKSSGLKRSRTAKLKWFVATMKSGHTGVFQRNPGKKRGEKKEISEIMGKSIPQMIGDEKRVYGIVEPYIRSDLEEAVSRHVKRAIKGEI